MPDPFDPPDPEAQTSLPAADDDGGPGESGPFPWDAQVPPDPDAPASATTPSPRRRSRFTCARWSRPAASSMPAGSPASRRARSIATRKATRPSPSIAGSRCASPARRPSSPPGRARSRASSSHSPAAARSMSAGAIRTGCCGCCSRARTPKNTGPIRASSASGC